MYTPEDKVREVENGGHQTYRPAFEADKMAFSARLKPSAEPEVTQSSHTHFMCIKYCEGGTEPILCVSNIVRQEQMVRIWLYMYMYINVCQLWVHGQLQEALSMCLPMAIEVHCLLC